MRDEFLPTHLLIGEPHRSHVGVGEVVMGPFLLGCLHEDDVFCDVLRPQTEELFNERRVFGRADLD
jgi:hypothetical protein